MELNKYKVRSLSEWLDEMYTTNRHHIIIRSVQIVWEWGCANESYTNADVHTKFELTVPAAHFWNADSIEVMDGKSGVGRYLKSVMDWYRARGIDEINKPYYKFKPHDYPGFADWLSHTFPEEWELAKTSTVPEMEFCRALRIAARRCIHMITPGDYNYYKVYTATRFRRDYNILDCIPEYIDKFGVDEDELEY